MITVAFEVDGRKISRALDFAAKDVGDLSQPLKNIGSELRKTFQLNFAARGDLYGGWAPRKRQYPWPLLEKTGRMRRNFRQTSTSNTLTLDNPTWYFRFHQLGTSRLPQRVMMKLREQDAQMAVKTIQSFCISALRARGLR